MNLERRWRVISRLPDLLIAMGMWNEVCVMGSEGDSRIERERERAPEIKSNNKATTVKLNVASANNNR